MTLLSANKTLGLSNLIPAFLQSMTRRFFPSSLPPLNHSNPISQKPLVPASSPSAADTSPQEKSPECFSGKQFPGLNPWHTAAWGNFAARVSGEWDGFGVEFTAAEGRPLELPESVVPDAFREWGVQIFDWQTQCSALASGTKEPLFFCKLVKFFPTVGCEADAPTQHSVYERAAGSSENNALALGFHPSGRYICVWHGKGMLELEHCFVNPENWEERMRVIQVVRIEEGMVSLEKIWIFSEHRYGPFRNGEQLGGCAVKETGFASKKAVEAPEILGEWEGGERFSAGGLADQQKFQIHQLVKEHSKKSIRDQLGLITLPKNLWCYLKVKDDGETWAEVGWLAGRRHAMTSRCVLHNDGRLKEMIIEEEQVKNNKST